jgi:HSP20 family protein
MKKDIDFHLSSGFLMGEEKGLFCPLGPGVWQPNVDLCETKNLITLRAEVPGVKLEDLSVRIKGNLLTVSGIKRQPQIDEKPFCYICLERVYGEFTREIEIQYPVDGNNAQAWLQDGILTIELPKLERVIEVPILKK